MKLNGPCVLKLIVKALSLTQFLLQAPKSLRLVKQWHRWPLLNIPFATLRIEYQKKGRVRRVFKEIASFQSKILPLKTTLCFSNFLQRPPSIYEVAWLRDKNRFRKLPSEKRQDFGFARSKLANIYQSIRHYHICLKNWRNGRTKPHKLF